MALLRNSLWGVPLPDMTLSGDEWLQLHAQARRHKVHGVLYRAVASLPAGAGVPDGLLNAWADEARRIRERNRQVSHVADVQAQAWTRRGIHAVELKGRKAAAFYPEPLLRVCGDIDWWFPEQEDWDAALVAARENGCYPERDSDGDVHYMLGGVVVEHHRHGLEAGGALGQLLLFNTHILHHAMGAGIGLRHLCDLALALDGLAGGYDRGEYLSRLEAGGLGRWNAVLEETLGILRCGHGPAGAEGCDGRRTTRLARTLLSSIMADGEFGLGRRRRFAGMARRAWFFLRVAPLPFISHWLHLIKGHISRR